MRIIRSARGWATASVGLVLVLLIATTMVALFATRTQQSQLESLEASSRYATALTAARAEFLSANAALAALASFQDTDYLIDYQKDLGFLRNNLSQARTIALSEGREADVASVDDLIRRMDAWEQDLRDGLALYIAGDEEGTAQSRAELEAATKALSDVLLLAADGEQASVSAQRAAAVETAARSFRLQLILGAFALVAGTVAGVTLVLRTRELERNIEQRKQAEAHIRHMAFHDALTNLPNRALLQDRLATALAQARRQNRMLALLFLDLDRFKHINDIEGHAVGDQVLQGVAERLKGIVREADTVARVGGDEFTVLLPEACRVEDATDVAERILRDLRRPFVLHKRQFHTTTSIGIAFYPADADEADTLLRNADIAMYRAKEQGRDNYQFYTAAMNAQIAERLTLENDLRRGLENGEFVVYYQPQVDITSYQIVGVEALVRWQHPERGFMLPGEFIPVAEESGLIVPLGEWVLRTACAQAKAWQEAGRPHIRMAVNLSARQFQQRDLLEVIGQVLTETRLDPRCLQLEITEGAAMHDLDFTITTLSSLKEMGVQIAIDDFGSGHSSLNYLKRLPIDDVKIDRSFVRDLAVDPNDATIVGSIVTMTHDLRLKVVAEGVETQEQLSFLQDRRCDVVQGFLFSKPMPADALEKMIRRRPRLKVAAPGLKSASTHSPA